METDVKSKYRFLAALVVFGSVLFSGGLYFLITMGYGPGTPPGGTSATMTLAQQVYYPSSLPKYQGAPYNGRVYLGDLLGVYSIGTKVCKKYTASPNLLTCTQWQQENGWGILLNGAPETLTGGDTVVSAVYALIPIVQSGTLTGYRVAELDQSDATLGHTWIDKGTRSFGSLGVELHLYDQVTYPASPLDQ